jgi:hypothetical protein
MEVVYDNRNWNNFWNVFIADSLSITNRREEVDERTEEEWNGIE